MVNPVVEFLVGAAVIVTPQYQVPLLIGSAALKLGSSLVQRSNSGRENGQQTAQDGGIGAGKVMLEWEHLSVALPKKKSGTLVPIFEDLQGSAKPGRLLAIMGSSGAGKTTLLNCLAGQLPYGKGVSYSGVISVNGAPTAESRHSQAYVKQDDVFYSQLTVRETLTTAARLQMGPEDGAGVEDVVERLIEKLGLSKAADTIVGNAKVRGLSGGERKRLSIAVELLGDPSLLFCDEPTTGLDSFQAEQVMKALKQLAGEGKTVAVAIHQPRSSVFALFDDLVLLSEGGLVYSGPASEAVAYFERQGFTCPPNYNPAEFLADLISVDQSSSEARKETRERVEKLKAACKSSLRSDVNPTSPPAGVPKNGHEEEEDIPEVAKRRAARWGLQARVLLQRSWRQMKRDKATTVARVMSNVSSAAIFGSIYWRMGRKQVGVQNRMGLLQVAAINCAMSSVVKTLGVFSQERVIVERERSKGSYAVGPYFGAKLAAESPIGALFPLLFGCLLYPTTGLNPKASRFAKFLGILTLESFVSSSVGLAVGSVAPSPDAAQAIGPAVMVVFIVFGGLYVNSSGVPRALRWLPKASLIKHAFEALCVNEFRGLEFDGSEPAVAGDALVGEQVLQRLSFQDSSVSKAMAGEVRILLFNYWFTYCVLKARKPKFQTLQTPGSAAVTAEEEP